jgi:hypothetical protein
MSRHSLCLALVIGLATLVPVGSAQAAPPGSPVGAGTFKLPINEGFLGELKESNSVNLAGVPGLFPTGLCDGYLVLTEEGAGAGAMSDIVVFHDGVTLPSGVCGPTVTWMTIISDASSAAEGPDASILPTTGCLMQPGTPGPVCTPLPQYQFDRFTQTGGSLANLTAEIVAAGAGLNANSQVQEVVRSGVTNGAYLAAGPLGTATYIVFSDVPNVPALPPWAFGVLGGVLMVTAFAALRLRRQPLASL